MKDFVSKHSLALFFALTIPLAWVWWIQMVLGIWPTELLIIPSSMGGISPILTLWILQKLSNRAVDLNRIINSVRTWRTNIPWLLAAVFILPVLTTLGNVMNFILGFENQLTLFDPGPAKLGLILIPAIPITFILLLIFSQAPYLRSLAGEDLYYRSCKRSQAGNRVVLSQDPTGGCGIR